MQSFKKLAWSLIALAPATIHAQSVQLKDLVGTWVGGPIWIYQRSTPFNHQSRQEAVHTGIAARLSALRGQATDTVAIRHAVEDSLDNVYIAYVLKTAPDTLVIWPDTTFSSTTLGLGPKQIAHKDPFTLLPGDTVSWTFRTLWTPVRIAMVNGQVQTVPTGKPHPRVVRFHINIENGKLHWLGLGSLPDENSYYRRIDDTPKAVPTAKQ